MQEDVLVNLWSFPETLDSCTFLEIEVLESLLLNAAALLKWIFDTLSCTKFGVFLRELLMPKVLRCSKLQNSAYWVFLPPLRVAVLKFRCMDNKTSVWQERAYFKVKWNLGQSCLPWLRADCKSLVRSLNLNCLSIYYIKICKMFKNCKNAQNWRSLTSGLDAWRTL